MSTAQLLRHSLAYALARAVPALLTFATLALYTRWLSPQQFGEYALVLAAVTLGRVVLFHWVRLSLLRLLPAHGGNRSTFLSTVGGGYALSCLLGAAFGLALIAVGYNSKLAALGVALLCAYGWLDMNLDLLRTDFQPGLYGVLLAWRTAWGLVFGAIMVLYGWGAIGALLGNALGALLPGPGSRSLFAQWRLVRVGLFNRQLFWELAAYGLPPTVAVAFTFIVSTSDRIFLAWICGEGIAGLYSAGYDLAQNAINGLLLPVSLASLPLAVRALETSGPRAAARELGRSFVTLSLIGVPAVWGLAVLAPNVSHVLLGPSFRDTAATILPWIVSAEFFGALIGIHFNRAFQLSKRTGKQIQPYAIAAVVNIALNLWWIPRLGVMGAVYSTTIAYVVAVLLSWNIGRRVFPIPVPLRPLTKIMIASALMTAVLWPIRSRLGGGWLAFQVALGAFTFAVALSILTKEWHPQRVLQRLTAEKAAINTQPTV